LQALLGGSLGDIHLRGHFNLAYDGSWDIPAISSEVGEGELTMAASSLSFQGRFDTPGSDATLNVGTMSFIAPHGAQVSVSGITGPVSIKELVPGVYLSNYQLEAGEVKINNPAGMGATLSNLGFAQIQTANGDIVDTALKLTLGKLSGPVEVSNGYYEIQINQLNAEHARDFSLAMNQAMASMQGSDQAAQVASFKKLYLSELPKLLQPGLNMQLNLGAEFMGGQPNAHWSLNYLGPSAGKTLNDLSSSQDYLALVDSDLLISAPATLVGATPVQVYVGTYVTAEGNDYQLKARLHDGMLKVGNVDIPQEQLQAMVDAFITNFNKAAAKPAAASNADPDYEDYEEESSAAAN